MVYFLILLLAHMVYSSESRVRIPTPIPARAHSGESSSSSDDIICEAAVSILDSFSMASPDLILPYIRETVSSHASLPDYDHERISSDLIRRKSGDLTDTHRQSLDYINSIVIQSVLKAVDANKVKMDKYQDRLNRSWSRRTSSIAFGLFTSITTTLVGLIVHYNKGCK